MDKIEWVLPAIPQQQMDEAAEAAKAAQAERFMAKVQHEYDDFRARKKYVLEHLHLLRDTTVPIHVRSIQFLASHECVIFNDMELVPFDEVLDMIRARQKQLAKEKEDGHAVAN